MSGVIVIAATFCEVVGGVAAGVDDTGHDMLSILGVVIC